MSDPTTEERDAALWPAYAETTFRVFTENGELDILPNTSSQELDALLLDHDVDCWAVITAWNPDSAPTSPEQNAAQNEALRNVVEAEGYATLRTLGIGADERWEPEASFFVLGVDRTRAIELGAEFGQKAIVWGRARGVATLIDCGSGEDRVG